MFAVGSKRRPRTHRAKQSQSAAVRRTNKANLPPGSKGWEPERPPVPPVGAIVRNKANLPGPTESGTGGQRRVWGRRWGQACETKPIRPKRQDEQVLGAKGFMAN